MRNGPISPARRSADLEPRLAVEEGDAENAKEVQAHADDDDSGKDREHGLAEDLDRAVDLLDALADDARAGPSEMKTTEKPRTKASAAIMTRRNTIGDFMLSVRSSSVTPAMKVR